MSGGLPQAFLDAIVADIEGDAPRLIYADWLEERGDVRGAVAEVDQLFGMSRGEICVVAHVAGVGAGAGGDDDPGRGQRHPGLRPPGRPHR